MSSKEFLRSHKLNEKSNKTSGPAVCGSLQTMDTDTVQTFPCYCPGILDQWIKRPRKHNWPPVQTRHRIANMLTDVVATGISGCSEEELEWRLCFNEIEQLIIECWNDTQTKLFIAMKMIRKDILKSLEKNISTYMLKNLVFWLSESYPQNDFTHKRLYGWILKTIKLLKRAVKLNYLPCYMIPNRNLLTERIQKEDRKAVIQQLDSIIQACPYILYQSRKLRFAVSLSSVELFMYKEKCEKLEVLLLQDGYFYQLKTVEGYSDDDIDRMHFTVSLYSQIDFLVFSPWPSMVQKELDKCSSRYERIQFLLG